MKRSGSDSLLQHSEAPAAVELVTGVWLLHLSNPENNRFSQGDGEDEGIEEGERGIKWKEGAESAEKLFSNLYFLSPACYLLSLKLFCLLE